MLKPEVRAEIDRLATQMGSRTVSRGDVSTRSARVATNLARAKLEAITHDDERRIEDTLDEEVLTRLVDALGVAHTARDARAALDKLVPDHA